MPKTTNPKCQKKQKYPKRKNRQFASSLKNRKPDTSEKSNNRPRDGKKQPFEKSPQLRNFGKQQFGNISKHLTNAKHLKHRQTSDQTNTKSQTSENKKQNLDNRPKS
jgi:hypothetical protein